MKITISITENELATLRRVAMLRQVDRESNIVSAVVCRVTDAANQMDWIERGKDLPEPGVEVL